MRPLLSLLCAAILSAQAQAPAKVPVPTRISDLAWMVGHWRGAEDGGVFEEVWTAPEQGQMQGMARELKDGQARSVELCLVQEGADGLVMRMRHFDGDLNPRETGAALRWRVTGGDGHTCVDFEEAGGVRLHYLRTGDHLVATLEKGGRSFRFDYTRAK